MLVSDKHWMLVDLRGAVAYTYFFEDNITEIVDDCHKVLCTWWEGQKAQCKVHHGQICAHPEQ